MAHHHITIIPERVITHDDADWEVYKDVIELKYMTEGKPTNLVREEMEQLGFYASIQQYERRYRKWGWRKHVKQSVYDEVERALKRKLLTADQSDITIDGQALPRKKLMKAMNRRQPGLYEQMAAKVCQEPMSDQNELAVRESIVAQTASTITIRPSLRSGLSMDTIEQLPTLDVLDRILSRVSQAMEANSSASNFNTANTIAIRSFQPKAVDCLQSEARLPTHVLPILETHDALIAAPQDFKTISIAMYYFSMLANGHKMYDEEFLEEIADVFLLPEMEQFLKWLITAQLPATIAMRQQLLRTAVLTGSAQLLHFLIRYGIDVHMILPDAYSDSPRNAVQLAVENQQPQILEHLLQAGASAVKCSNPQCDHSLTKGSKADTSCCCCDDLPIKLALTALQEDPCSQAAFTQLRLLIDSASTVCGDCLDLRGIIDCDIDTIKALFVKSDVRLPIVPRYWQSDVRYCSALQGALAHYNFDLAQLLEAQGADIDIHPTSQNMRGSHDSALSVGDDNLKKLWDLCVQSPLALAFGQNQLALAARYLRAGADPNVCYFDILRNLDPIFTTDYHEFLATETFPDYDYAGSLERLERNDDILRNLIDSHENPIALCYPLQVAVTNECIDSVELLFQYGANLSPIFGTSPLLLAIIESNIRLVAILLERAAITGETMDVLYARTLGLSPLLYAVMTGQAEILELLIHAGADVLRRSPSGIMAFEAAIWYGSSPACIELILARIVVQDESQMWMLRPELDIIGVLAAAAVRGRYKIMLSLAQFIVHLSCGPRARTFTALTQSLSLDFEDSLSFTSKCYDALLGRSLLAESAFPGSYEEDFAAMIGQIVGVGEAIGPNWIRRNLNTALMLGAIRSKNGLWARNLLACGFNLCPQSIDALRKQSCNPSFKNWSELFEFVVSFRLSACEENFYRLITSALIQQMLALNCRNGELEHRLIRLLWAGYVTDVFQHGWTSSEILVWGKGALDTVRILLQHKVDITMILILRDNFERSLLGHAIENNDLEGARLLLHAGANPAAPANWKLEPSLTIATRLGRQEIVLTLIATGCSPNFATPAKEFARTPLQAACEEGHLDIVTILINHDANVNAEAGADCGVTALQAAAIKGYFKICQMLIGVGAKVSAPASPKHGRTAIDGAAENGRLDVVHYLLERYDGHENMIKVCRRARRYAKSRHRTGVVALLDERLAALQDNDSTVSRDFEELGTEDESMMSNAEDDDTTGGSEKIDTEG